MHATEFNTGRGRGGMISDKIYKGSTKLDARQETNHCERVPAADRDEKTLI